MYSLGCVLYETLTGQRPFGSDLPVAVLFGHLSEPPPRASEARPDLGAGVDTVVGRAMAKEPDARYSTGSELVDAAAGVLLGAGGRRRRRVLVGALVALVVVVAAVVAAVLLTGGGGESEGFGDQWSRVPHRDDDLRGGVDRAGVTAGPETFVAVGFQDDNVSDIDAAAWTSPGGLTWSRVQHRETTLGGTGHQRMEAVAAGDDLFVAVGHDEEVDAAGSPTNLDAAVWTSPEGLEWTRVPHDETVFGGPPITSEFEPGRVGDPSSQAMVDVTTGGPGFVAVRLAEDAATGDTAAVWTSADGLSWARVTDQADLDHTTGSGLLWMTGVTEADGRLVAVGWETSSERQFSAAVWTSEDGLAWTRLPHDGAAFGSGSQWFGMDDVVGGRAGVRRGWYGDARRRSPRAAAGVGR